MESKDTVSGLCPACRNIVQVSCDLLPSDLYSCESCSRSLTVRWEVGMPVLATADSDAIKIPSVPSSEKISPSELGVPGPLASGREG